MAEYIEREAALEAVTVWYKKACQPENMSSYNMGERDAYITAISEIIELPTTDVRPVVRGRWIVHYDDIWPTESTQECSECHKEVPLLIDCKFCPNCGADMRPRPKEET